ncbi:hypothetical protein KCU91_g8501, partial [Aureobasidium melanogenum]
MTNEQQNQRVYLCVGNTGTGKSTFVRSMGGDVHPRELVASGGSLTNATTFYPAGPASSVLLVDTPGFGDSRSSDDPSEFSNSKHRAKILSAFKHQKLSHFNGVFWFINDPKVSKELEDQARYINDLVNPEIPGSTANRSIGWLHVVVMLRGAATEGFAVKLVVKEVTGSAEVSERLCLKNIGLSLNGKNPGDCDLKIEGVSNSQGREIHELQESFKSKALSWFHAIHPIKWLNNHGKCLDCLQEGDPLLGLGAALSFTGAALSLAVTVIAPNPATPIAAGTLLHMTISAAAISAGAVAADSASASFGKTIVDPRKLDAMITSGQLDVTTEELKELEHTIKEYTTKRGKCSRCQRMANEEPCIYFWTCCKRAYHKDERALSDSYDGCKAMCTNCEEILVEDDETQGPDHKSEVPGCLNQCSGCGAIADEEDFSNNGCGTARHNLVYLPIYDEFC